MYNTLFIEQGHWSRPFQCHLLDTDEMVVKFAKCRITFLILISNKWNKTNVNTHHLQPCMSKSYKERTLMIMDTKFILWIIFHQKKKKKIWRFSFKIPSKNSVSWNSECLHLRAVAYWTRFWCVGWLVRTGSRHLPFGDSVGEICNNE